ncbi:MAG: hypothetical protein NTY77_08850 [Elusimicrobia bacterium]|nr:hypothetical protein [Elusimicrobiota bacterium]
MQDRFGSRKWAFWLVVGLIGAVTVVPSAVLLRALQSYYDFLTGAAPATIRPIQVRFLDHRGDFHSPPEQDLRFAEFRLRAPKAKAVDLIGDFNGWKAGTLLLSRAAGGSWEIMLPLPPGAYHYLFLVDGQTTPDPEARAETAPGGKPVSVRTVK